MKLSELLEKRDHATKAYRDLVKKMTDEKRAPDADERAKMDNMVFEIEDLESQIRKAQADEENEFGELKRTQEELSGKIADYENILSELRIGDRGFDEGKPQIPEEMRDFKIFLETGEKRATLMTDSTGATGGYLVPDKFYNELKEYQADLSPIWNLATVTIWDADAVFPVISGFGSTTLVARGSAKTGNVPTVGQKNLSGYQFIYNVPIPETLLRKSAYNIEQRIPKWWGKSRAGALEDYFAEGVGTTEPTGLITGATAGTDSASNSAIAGDDVVNWYFDLDAAYRKRAAWLFADSTVALIRKIKNPVTTSGALNYIWMPGLGGQPDTLMGRPIYASDGFSAFSAGAACGVFGDISEFQIVEFGKPSLIRDPYSLADYGQVRFVGYQLIDCDLPVAEAVITCMIAA